MPGSRWAVGAITTAPYTCGNSRRASRSFSTAFWTHTSGVEAGAAARSAASASAVSWLLVASSTTSPCRQSMPDGDSWTGTFSVTAAPGRSKVSPRSRMARACAPRAISATSCPAW